MIWRGETYEQRLERLQHWHWHFAWMPVQFADGRTVWLQRIRRRLQVDRSHHTMLWWEYAMPGQGSISQADSDHFMREGWYRSHW